MGGTANGVGHFTATCGGAKDNAGNTAPPASAGYDVHYVFSGFLTALSPDGHGKTFNAGSTIPVKWNLKNAQGGFIVTPSAVGDNPYFAPATFLHRRPARACRRCELHRQRPSGK